MKSVFLACGLFFMLLSFYNCNTRQYTTSNLPEEQLLFGEGGGFTGAVTEYTLLENGQLFRTNSLEGNTMEIGKLEKKQAKQLIREAEKLGLEKMDIQEPGNLYYFIGMKDDGKTHKITWGDPEYKITPEIQVFYKKLTAIANQAVAPTK